MLADAGTGPEAARLFGELEAIRARGEMVPAELRTLDARLDRRITTSRGTSYEGTISVASKVAFQLALDGRLGRDRPRGTWISGQFRWSPTERWLPGGIQELPVGAVDVRLDDGQAGYVLPGDLETTPEPEPWVALLPVLDAITMG